MSTRPSATVQGVAAGAVSFLLAILPTAGIYVAASSGSVGTLPIGRWFLMPSALVVAAVSIGSGILVTRALSGPRAHRPGTVWSAYVPALAIVAIGCWLIPFLMIATMVDSDHSLAQRGPAIVAVWVVAHLLVAAAGVGALRRTLRRDPDLTPREPAPPPSVRRTLS